MKSWLVGAMLVTATAGTGNPFGKPDYRVPNSPVHRLDSQQLYTLALQAVNSLQDHQQGGLAGFLKETSPVWARSARSSKWTLTVPMTMPKHMMAHYRQQQRRLKDSYF